MAIESDSPSGVRGADNSGLLRTLGAVFVTAGVFFAVGLVVGREWREETVDGRITEVAEASAPASAVAPARRRTGQGGHALEPSSLGTPLRASLPVDKMQIEQLRDELAQARQDLVRYRQEREEEIGKPVPFPEDLPELYSQGEMVQRMTDAFRHAGIEADVTVADCDEYPCLLCGDVGQDEGSEPKIDEHVAAMRKAAEAPSLQPYEQGQKHGSVMTSKVDREGTPMHTTRFCQAMYPDPDDPELAEEIEQRVRYRIQQLEQGL